MWCLVHLSWKQQPVCSSHCKHPSGKLQALSSKLCSIHNFFCVLLQSLKCMLLKWAVTLICYWSVSATNILLVKQ
jgi:hypothetical protein